jgi:14-3-3 protein epsilon
MSKDGDLAGFVEKVLAQDASTQKDIIQKMDMTDQHADICVILKKMMNKNDHDSLRHILSASYKHQISELRSSWRQLKNETEKSPSDLGNRYVKIIEERLRVKANEVIDLVKGLIKPENERENLDEEKAEIQVFYLKMVADYQRYLCEIEADEQKKKKGKEAQQYYEQASELAKAKLKPTDATLLGLALNYSVCLYEILKECEKASAVAKEAFETAIAKLDTLNDDTYKDSTLILQLLRDNLTLWQTEHSKQEEQPEEY